MFPNAIRIGNVETKDSDILSVSFDHLCQKKLRKMEEMRKTQDVKLKKNMMELSAKLEKETNPSEK